MVTTKMITTTMNAFDKDAEKQELVTMGIATVAAPDVEETGTAGTVEFAEQATQVGTSEGSLEGTQECPELEPQGGNDSDRFTYFWCRLIALNCLFQTTHKVSETIK
jgi:hypothetical protein